MGSKAKRVKRCLNKVWWTKMVVLDVIKQPSGLLA